MNAYIGIFIVSVNTEIHVYTLVHEVKTQRTAFSVSDGKLSSMYSRERLRNIDSNNV